MAAIPAAYRDLLGAPTTVSLATLLPSGQPQVTPVWCDLDGDHIRINTAKGRQKHKDMLADPRVTVLAVDPTNSYRYIEVRGTVVRIEEAGAAEHADNLAKEYMGADKYRLYRPEGQRVICYIEAQRVLAQG